MANSKSDEKKGNNPTGKGGFADNPENRNPGGWRKETSISYQYKRFMAMTVKEFEAIAKKPPTERTVVENLAINRVLAARNSLNDVKEITDRTEGKAPQTIDFGGKIETVTTVEQSATEMADEMRKVFADAGLIKPIVKEVAKKPTKPKQTK